MDFSIEKEFVPREEKKVIFVLDIYCFYESKIRKEGVEIVFLILTLSPSFQALLEPLYIFLTVSK